MKGLKRQLAAALVAISEIYMTDLCDEPEAEQVCGDCLNEALSVDDRNWETLQAIASYRISQQNPEDALVHMKRSFELWKDMEPEDIDRPTHDARVAAAKLFIELEAYEEGSEVLESLLEDDDENAETWYLTAFCYSHTDVESAPEYIERAKELLTKQNITDPGIMKQIHDLTRTVEQKLQNMPPASNGDE